MYTKDYTGIAKEVRRDVLGLIHKGQTSHIASNFSLVDVAVYIYENIGNNDVVVWSKGWAAALFYILSIRKGDLDKNTVFSTFPNEPFLGLLERGASGAITAGGSVGHGLSVAVGMALARKRSGQAGTVYCLMSDGELNEGSVWEAAMVAAHHKLDNIVVVVDSNGWQAMGRTKDVIDQGSVWQKFLAFGWDIRDIDGHDFRQITGAFDAAGSGKPYAIIAHTVKGKGVSFMENHLTYHYKHVDDETYAKAMEELQ